MDTQIQKAAESLQNNGVGIFPTDTVYGIGCKLDDEKALQKLFKIRNRPEEKAVLAVVDSVEMAEKYVIISEEVKTKLIQKYWPGGLTIVLPCKTDTVPSLARGGGMTLGIRQTNHPVLLELLKKVGVPIVAPSANFAGKPTPKSFADVDKNLLSLVDFAIDGICGGNMASTVIDCTVNPWKILREGAVEVKL